MVIWLCTDVPVSVQRNEAAIVRLLTVSARLSGEGMIAICHHVSVLPRQGVLSWRFVRIATTIRQGR
ncbi:hypothetical protein ACFBBR_004729 [Escherichia coli]|nr:hypothetical protein [Escherichia coli]